MRKRPKNIITRIIMWLAVVIILILAAIVWQNYLRTQNNNEVSVVSRDGIITQIQSLSRLETMAYNIDTVVTSETKGNWFTLWQDAQKGLFIVQGQVIAGIDFDKLKPEQVRVNTSDNSIEIDLPAVEVFKTSLDKIEVYDITGGILSLKPMNKNMLEKIQVEAKRQVQVSACRADILNIANQNAKKQVTQLFALTGMQVTVNTQAVPNCK